MDEFEDKENPDVNNQAGGEPSNQNETHSGGEQQTPNHNENAGDEPRFYEGGAPFQNNGFGGYQSQGGNPYGGQSGPSWNQGQYQSYQKKEDDYQWNFESYDEAQKTDETPPVRPKKSRGLTVFISIICVVLAIGVLCLAGIGLYSILQGKISNPNDGQQQQQQQEGQSGPSTEIPQLELNDKPRDQEETLPDGRLTSTQIAKKVKPSVVGIVSYQKANNLAETTQKQGSGIIMSQDGYIVTNAHVISGADGVKVVLSNGDEFTATIKGIDTRTDLAVVKIDQTGLAYAEFGNSDQLQDGEKVLAIGNPGGLELAGSVTQGIVSAVNRLVKSGSDSSYAMKCIQTDAAINPGNSGGALVNEFGQVIGINSSKIAATDYEGVGFAIPINEAKPIIDDLMNYGRVTGRVKIGIGIDEVDEITAKLYDVPTGILVGSVEPNSDAASKGLQSGDIITHINDERVETLDQVRQVIDSFKPGDTIKVTVYRLGDGNKSKTIEFHVILMEDTGTSTK